MDFTKARELAPRFFVADAVVTIRARHDSDRNPYRARFPHVL